MPTVNYAKENYASGFKPRTSLIEISVCSKSRTKSLPTLSTKTFESERYLSLCEASLC